MGLTTAGLQSPAGRRQAWAGRCWPIEPTGVRDQPDLQIPEQPPTWDPRAAPTPGQFPFLLGFQIKLIASFSLSCLASESH